MSEAGAPTLAARDVACERGNRLLFEGLDFRLEAGQALHARGPNGSGKTSLLRILCGLGLPARGEVLWRGRAVRPGDEGFLRDMLYVAHADGIKRELTAIENLRAFVAIRGAGGLAPEAALERVELAAHPDTPVRGLSAGQSRRVALARLLTTSAPLWILDEPFNALDAAGTRLVAGLLEGHLAAGGIVVLTSHVPLALDPSRVLEAMLG